MTENERQPVRTFIVDETAAGERLDKFLSTVCPDLTRSAAARVIEEGGVLLDGAPGNKKDKLRPGTRVELRLPEPKPMEVLPEFPMQNFPKIFPNISSLLICPVISPK